MMYKDHKFYIAKSFELAKKGKGYVSPNPMVGAVLVKNGLIISEGFHQKFGGPHAEVNAIENANESVRGSTLYCNLEPCCHLKKKTPPCAQRIVKEGIKKVVISNLDPNPEVSGNGVELLKSAGIEVETRILEKEGEEVNKFYLNFVKFKIPYVTIKIAQSMDGFIYSKDSEDRWITGKESRKLVHQWRSEYDAVLIGAQTVIVDNPELTVRDTAGRNPFRIILDGNLRVSPNSKIFKLKNPDKTIVFTYQDSNHKYFQELQDNGIKLFKIEQSSQKINLKTILKELGNIGITSLLVEGGNQVFSQFIAEKIYNDIKIFMSAKFLGSGISPVKFDSIVNLNLSKINKIDNDLLLTYLP